MINRSRGMVGGRGGMVCRYVMDRSMMRSSIRGGGGSISISRFSIGWCVYRGLMPVCRGHMVGRLRGIWGRSRGVSIGSEMVGSRMVYRGRVVNGSTAVYS